MLLVSNCKSDAHSNLETLSQTEALEGRDGIMTQSHLRVVDVKWDGEVTQSNRPVYDITDRDLVVVKQVVLVSVGLDAPIGAYGEVDVNAVHKHFQAAVDRCK